MKFLASRLNLDPATAHLIEQHPWVTAAIVITGIIVLWIVVGKAQSDGMKLTRHQKKRSLILSAAFVTVLMTSLIIFLIVGEIKHPNGFPSGIRIMYVFAPFLIVTVWLYVKQSIDKLPPE